MKLPHSGFEPCIRPLDFRDSDFSGGCPSQDGLDEVLVDGAFLYLGIVMCGFTYSAKDSGFGGFSKVKRERTLATMLKMDLSA